MFIVKKVEGGITFKDILARAETKANLECRSKDDAARWTGTYCSLAKFNLGEAPVRDFFEREGFEFREGPHVRFAENPTYYAGTTQLVMTDTNPSKKLPHGVEPRESYELQCIFDTWRYPPAEFQLAAKLLISEKRAVHCRAETILYRDAWPHSFGHSKVFKLLAESGLCEVPKLVHDLIQNDGEIVWSWTGLGFPKIKRLSELFEEFVGRRRAVKTLGKRDKVFDPHPDTHVGFHQSEFFNSWWLDEWFIPREAQPAIINAWRKQLESRREKLTLPTK